MALFMGPLRYRGSRLFFQFAFFAAKVQKWLDVLVSSNRRA